MRVRIIRKADLSDGQTQSLRSRVQLDKHEFDSGPCAVWDNPPYKGNIFIALESATDDPIGILYRGCPNDALDVGWWLDSSFRGAGYGSEMIDRFASILKGEGVTRIGPITVDTYKGLYNEASAKLVRRLKAHFGQHIL